MAQYLELYLLAFLSGITWCSLGGVVGVWVLVSIAGWYAWWRLRGRVVGRRTWCTMACLCLLFFSAGYFRLYFAEKERHDFSQLLRGMHGDISLSGVLDADPVMREQGSLVTMEVENLMSGGVSLARHGMVRLELPRYPEYWRGQKMIVKGRVEWSDVSRIWVMRRALVVKADDPEGLSGWVLGLRQHLVAQMVKLFPGSAGGFLLGIIAGGGRGVSQSVLDDVRATGLTHVIAVSGYNVTLVLGLVLSVFAWVPRRWKVVPMGGVLLVFLLLVGMSASALRAALMGFLMVYALSAGRKRDLLLALLWSAIGMLLWRPFMLVEDRGFQLSFLATIGVCYLAPEVVARAKGRAPSWMQHFILEPFLTTLAVYLVTVPVLFSFQQFSLIGLVTNVVFVPFIPVFMVLAVGALIVSLIFWPLGFFVGRLGTVVVDGYFFALHGFAVLPFSNIEVPPMSSWVVIVYFNLLVVVYAKLRATSSPTTLHSESHQSHPLP